MCKQKITLIVAKAVNNNAIGIDNGLPWHIPEDLAFFKFYTLGKPVLMGRKTWESLPQKPLPQRRNIIITRNLNYLAEDVEIYHGITAAVWACQAESEICIIGGAEIYQQTMSLATDLMVTEVSLSVSKANCFFPLIDEMHWKIIAQEKFFSLKGIEFQRIHYQRR